MNKQRLIDGAPWSCVEDPNAPDYMKRQDQVWTIVDRNGDECPDYHPRHPGVTANRYSTSHAEQIVEMLNRHAAEAIMVQGTRAERP